jgi:hypothetical protein
MLSDCGAYFPFTSALCRKLIGEQISIRLNNSFSLLTCRGKINVFFSLHELTFELLVRKKKQ